MRFNSGVVVFLVVARLTSDMSLKLGQKTLHILKMDWFEHFGRKEFLTPMKSKMSRPSHHRPVGSWKYVSPYGTMLATGRSGNPVM